MKYSELRQDLVSGDWILFAPGRARKPEQFIQKERIKKAPKAGCPFENPASAAGGIPLAIYNHSDLPSLTETKDWRIQIIPNKYPAVVHSKSKIKVSKRGPYSVMPGVGHHEVLITRNHDKNFANLGKKDAELVFKAFRDRYSTLLDDDEIAYIAVFHNWGPKAGASIYHPHYQMIAVPVVPPDIEHSLEGSQVYFRKHHKCVHCVQISMEKKDKKRIIFENECAIAFAPFVSRSEFEIRVFPKVHISFFENTPIQIINCMAGALQKVLKGLEKSLNYPDYNFFIHTAPLKDRKKYKHYHWHIEVQPKINIQAGFELGTGIEINVADPDEAARIIRKNV
jgi:UDPglucose--hexose-1-phosphate uridylyltransferase